MSSMDKTMQFNFPDDSVDVDVQEVLLSVYEALEEKGYNPINQIVGYLLSGDPATTFYNKRETKPYTGKTLME